MSLAEFPLLPDIDRSGLCLTNTSVFTHWAGTGDVCNGRGTCVNGLCVCDAGWTGRGDLFTLEGYACVVPVLLEEVLWYMVVAANLLAFLYALVILRSLSKQKGSMRKWKITFTAGLAFGFSLPMAALGISRAYLHQNLGVDVLPSLLLLCCIYVSQILIGMDNLRFCKFLVTSNIANAQVKDKLMSTLLRREIAFITGFLFTLSLAVIAGIVMPHAPTQVRYGLLLLRTAGLVTWFGQLFAVNGLVLHELNKVKDALRSGVNKNSKDDQRLAAVIASLEAQLHHLRNAVTVIGPVIIVVVICPPLAVFDFVVNALIFILTANAEVGKYAQIKSGRGEESSGDGISHRASKPRHGKDEEEGMSANPTSNSKFGVTSGRDAASNGAVLVHDDNKAASWGAVSVAHSPEPQ